MCMARIIVGQLLYPALPQISANNNLALSILQYSINAWELQTVGNFIDDLSILTVSETSANYLFNENTLDVDHVIRLKSKTQLLSLAPVSIGEALRQQHCLALIASEPSAVQY